MGQTGKALDNEKEIVRQRIRDSILGRMKSSASLRNRKDSSIMGAERARKSSPRAL